MSILLNKCVLTLALVISVGSVSILRYKTNLILYGGYYTGSRHIIFTNSEQSEWNNLDELVQNSGLPEKALLCVVGSGGWLTYPFPDYKNDNGNGRLLIGDTCIPAGNVKSAQPIGLINKEVEGLVTFTEPFFQSEAQLFETKEGASQSGVKSLLSLEGTSGTWTVEGGGKKVCLIRPLGPSGICILPDLPTEMNMPDATITVGCSEANEPLKIDKINIMLQTCFDTFGAYSLIDSYLKLPVVKSLCEGGGDDSAKLGFYQIVDAWKFRMDEERQEEYNPANIDKNRDDDRTPMRLKLLTTFFEIFERGCPSLPAEYFNLVRYIFMQHLKSIWQEAPDVMQDRNDTRFTWTTAYNFVSECYEQTLEDPVPDVVPAACLDAQDQSRPNGEVGDALDLFLQGEKYDHIIEQVWIMLNYVSPYCAYQTKYRDNLWVEFVSFFRRQFLLPVLQQWLNPASWQIYYQFMFNGMTIERGKRQIITCVQKMLENTPGADPVDRPSAMASEFSSVSKKRPSLLSPSPKESSGQGARKKRKAPKSPGKKKTTTKPPTSHTLLYNRNPEHHGHTEHNTNHKTNRAG